MFFFINKIKELLVVKRIVHKKNICFSGGTIRYISARGSCVHNSYPRAPRAHAETGLESPSYPYRGEGPQPYDLLL